MTIIAANWKMHKTRKDARAYLEAFARQDKGSADIIFFVPYTVLDVFTDAGYTFGAENFHPEEKGAFTGEISLPMLRELGCTHVLAGHSERRHLFGEDDRLINRKVLAGLGQGFHVVLCVGEQLKEHEAGKTWDVVRTQLERGLDQVKDADRLMIAYEPVWAIGTGRCSQPADAEQVQKRIKTWLAERFSKQVPVLYGGSAKPDNGKDLLAQEHVDGFLVGGASLDPEQFAALCRL